MKVPGVLAVGCVLLLPISTRAQSITVKDLTGAWAKGTDISDTLFILADSTFINSGFYSGYAPSSLYPYLPINYLRGDTISLSQSDSPAVCRGERRGYCGEPGYKITLTDKQLTLTSLGTTSPWHSGTYTRIDAQPYGRDFNGRKPDRGESDGGDPDGGDPEE